MDFVLEELLIQVDIRTLTRAATNLNSLLTTPTRKIIVEGNHKHTVQALNRFT